MEYGSDEEDHRSQLHTAASGYAKATFMSMMLQIDPHRSPYSIVGHRGRGSEETEDSKKKGRNFQTKISPFEC